MRPAEPTSTACSGKPCGRSGDSTYSLTTPAMYEFSPLQMEAQTPLGRIGQPHDIAPAVVFLASADASWITGETLLIAGGLR